MPLLTSHTNFGVGTFFSIESCCRSVCMFGNVSNIDTDHDKYECNE